MKVLKEGKWNLPWSGKFSCPTCEAELLVEEADVKPTYNAMSYHCVCAVCGKAIYLKGSDFPLRVKEAVDKKREWSSFSDR